MKKWMLVLALVLLPASAHPSLGDPCKTHLHRMSMPSKKTEARLDQQKSKWAPNGMKVLIIHGKRRWVQKQDSPPVEKTEILPILKEGL